MKKTYKPGDEIKLSHFTKKQVAVITNQIELLNADQVGLDHFSIKLKRDRDIMLKIIQQSVPALKGYIFHIKHDTKTIHIVIDTEIN